MASLPTLSGLDVVRIFKAFGGTLRSLIRSANLTVDEFVEAA